MNTPLVGRRSTLATIAALAAIVAASFIVGRVTAQEAANPPAPNGHASPTPTVRPKILPDGSIQRDGVDGTRPGPNAGRPATEEDLTPMAPPAWLKDESTNKAFLAAMRDYYEYKSSGLKHRSRVFEWQLFSSKLIFVIVLLLVSVGLVFAAIQFRAGLKRGTPDARDGSTEIDISAGGVKVSSPVLGVIILVISLAFFYLYLVYVYPISELV